MIAHGALIRFVLLYAGLFSRSDWSRRSCRRSWPRAVFRLKTSGWCWAQEPIWLGAVCLLAASMATILVPAFPVGPPRSADAGSARVPWRVLFRRRAFVRVVIIAALVHGSHAMYDSLR